MIDDLATFLIRFMPYAAALKAGAFLVMTVMMYRQGSETNLAKWINRGFFGVMLSSIASTWFTYYIARTADSSDVHWPVEWGLIIFLNGLPVWVAICYGMIVYHNFNEGIPETRNARDTRQQETQEALDQATLANAQTTRINAARGNRLSRFGYKLDEKVTRLAEQQQSQNATDARQDQREHDADDRESTADQRDNMLKGREANLNE